MFLEYDDWGSIDFFGLKRAVRSGSWDDAWNPGWDDDWGDEDWEDPTQADYVFAIRGAVGEKIELRFVKGIHALEGSQENPIRLGITEKVKQSKGTFDPFFNEFDRGCYFSANLKKGLLYRFAVSGGDEKQPLDLQVLERQDFVLQPVPTEKDAQWGDAHNGALICRPAADFSCLIRVFPVHTNAITEADLTLKYQQVPARPVDEHPVVALHEENHWTAKFTPGRMNAPGSDFYDEIIDETLFAVQAEEGRRYVAQTAGAKTNLVVHISMQK